MKLPVKITLMLFFTIALFIVITAGFLYSEINKAFYRQTEARIAQTTTLLEHRIKFLQEGLDQDLEHLGSSLFREDEHTLAMMMARPPRFNSSVIGFAERLRRRTSLHFLDLISSDGFVLSSSHTPAGFGKPDAHPEFPLDQIAYIYEGSARMQKKMEARFGQRSVFLRGGYFIQSELQKLPLPGLIVEERNPTGQPFSATGGTDQTTRSTVLSDFADQPIVRVTLRVSNQDFLQQRARILQSSIWLIGIAFGTCLLSGYVLSFWISRPVARLRDAAEELSGGDLSVRVEEGSSGEIADLLRSFNNMAEQLQEKQQTLLQAQKIAAWQEIARHLAHEIKNPLAPIQTSITNLRLCMEKAPGRFPEIFLESSQSILEEVEKLRHLADEFSRFARLPAPVMKRGNLNEIIEKSLLLYPENSTIEFKPGDLPLVSFDLEQMSEVVHNLIQNALDAVESNGKIFVQSGLVNDQNRTEAFFRVTDNGTGMDPKTAGQAFAPYFTTKQKGTGLGLAIVHRIITEHNGRILFESHPGTGTKIEVRLPVD